MTSTAAHATPATTDSGNDTAQPCWETWEMRHTAHGDTRWPLRFLENTAKRPGDAESAIKVRDSVVNSLQPGGTFFIEVDVMRRQTVLKAINTSPFQILREKCPPLKPEEPRRYGLRDAVEYAPERVTAWSHD